MGGHGGHAAPLGLYWTVDEEEKKHKTKSETKEFISRRRQIRNKCQIHNIQNRVNCSMLVAETSRLLSHTVYMHMISAGDCSEQTRGVNRPSCVNALHGKHHSLCV